MNLKNKILPLTLGLLISVGTVGIANAAVSPDIQDRLSNWIQKDSNSMPMTMNNPTQPVNTVQVKSPLTTQNQSNVQNTASQNQQYEHYQQMMNTMTPEQMQAMYNTWLQIQKNGSVTNQNDLYQQMIQMDRQMMQNVTPEQMIQMDKAWMDQWLRNNQTNQVQQVQPQNNSNQATQTVKRPTTSTTNSNVQNVNRSNNVVPHRNMNNNQGYRNMNNSNWGNNCNW